ncbi:MAG: hypothetical protein R2800_13120 [Flavipsychrobacter sp.]
MRKYLLGAAMLMVVAVGCKKDKGLKNAIVIDSGDIAVGTIPGKDGCGFLLQLEEDPSKKLRPTNMPSNFTHNGLKVKIKYDSNGEGEICQIQDKYDFIEIIQLTKIERNLD